MLESTAAYKKAVVDTVRRTYAKAAIGIIDPDIFFGTISGSPEAAYSQPAQIINSEFKSSDTVVVLELNRVILNGTMTPLRDEDKREVGFIGETISNEDGVFSEPQTVTISFSNVQLLQAITLGFSDKPHDGVPADFMVQCGTKSWNYRNNTSTRVIMEDFTVENPTSITLTVVKWSIPGRRMRIIEIYPGLYEEWTLDDLYSLNVTEQANFASTALPYGTCTIDVDNTDRRFEPTSIDGIFRSIEERQGIDISIGVGLPDDTIEYKKIGRFYQYSGGWRTGQNSMTIQWSLVDIIGLLSSREYIPPATLPTTLSGWLASIVAQLGSRFTSAYMIDPSLPDAVLSPDNRESVIGKTCGDILMQVALAAGGYAVADASGKLAVKALGKTGTSVTLDNVITYPTVSANEDIAFIAFTLYDSNKTQYIVNGSAAASSNTVSVDNAFIKTTAQADKAAEIILAFYGGNAYSMTGRGNPASELGDVDTISITDSITATGRRVSQTFTFSDGVLQGCQATFIEVKP